jgi:hypothetical protein
MGLRLRNRTPVACVALWVSLLLVGRRASAATQVLAPSDDTFINSNYPTNNNGGSSSIFNGSDDQGGVMRGLIRFGMPLGLQGRVTVTNVQLNMTIRALENGNPGPGAVENLQAVTQSWLQGNGVGDGLFVGEACISGATWELSDCAAVTYWTTAGDTVAGASSGTASTAGVPIDGTVTWVTTQERPPHATTSHSMSPSAARTSSWAVNAPSRPWRRSPPRPASRRSVFR